MGLIRIHSILAVAVAALAVLAPRVRAQMHMGGNATVSLDGPCFKDPSQANCTSFMYPRTSVEADLDNLCKAMPFMPGCTLRFRCNETGATATANRTHNIACAPFHLLKTICSFDTGMSGMGGCKAYNAMCANGTVVPQCLMHSGLPYVPSTQTVNTEAKSLCEADPTLAGCSKCQPDWDMGARFGKCPLLLVYSAICFQNATAPQCAPYNDMCEKHTTEPDLYVCTSDVTQVLAAHQGNLAVFPNTTTPASPPSPPMHHGGGNSSADLSGPCFTNSSLPECADFRYPIASVRADLDNLCKAMPFMPGCTLYFRCNETGITGNMTYNIQCASFHLLKTICQFDTGMSGMGGCKAYNALCANGTVAPQCLMHSGLPYVPSTQTVNTEAKSLCEADPTLSGCSKCKPDWDMGARFGKCPLLLVYSAICLQNTTAPQCAPYNNMCEKHTTEPDLYVCTSAVKDALAAHQGNLAVFPTTTTNGTTPLSRKLLLR